jgi:hypothetical protein
MDWRHPVHRTVRHSTPIEIEAMYRLPMDDQGWSAYYVEAVREYAPGSGGRGLRPRDVRERLDPPAGKREAPHGSAARGSPTATAAAPPTCSRSAPCGSTTSQFWIYQISGHDREWYVIAHPTRRAIEIHAEYQAGYCPLEINHDPITLYPFPFTLYPFFTLLTSYFLLRNFNPPPIPALEAPVVDRLDSHHRSRHAPFERDAMADVTRSSRCMVRV